MTLLLLACSSPCTEGVEDEARTAAIEALAGELGEVCYGDRSVLVGATILLDSSQPDPDLAAKARHLDLHRHQGPDPTGAGCHEEWMRREEEAWAEERLWRFRLGLDEGPKMDPSLDSEYRARCEG